jgi:PAS domain S-box-containing protein
MRNFNSTRGRWRQRPRNFFDLSVKHLGPWIKRVEREGAEHRWIAGTLSLLAVGILGCINLGMPRGLNLEFFYLLVCCGASWIGGQVAGLNCVVASGLFLLLSEVMSGMAGGIAWAFACNSLVRLGAFAGITWLAARVGQNSRDLERAVVQRTARLRSEVEQHEQTSELLNEATELFRQVTQNITDVFWVTDPFRRVVEYVSPGFERLWGRPSQELYASAAVWMEALYHEDRERVTRSIYSRHAAGGYDEEYRVVRTDGSLHWVHDRAFPVKNSEGAVYRLVGIAEDITERKRSEQFLQAERDIGAALGSTSDLRFALERLLEIALQLEGLDCGGIYLMDPRTGELHLQAHRGLSKSFVERVGRYKSDAIEARLARTGRISYLSKDQIPRNLEGLWGSEGLQALAAVPIQHKGGVLGMLNLGSYQQEEIPTRTRVGIEMISTQVAGAIARIRAEEAQRRSEAHVRTVINSAPIALLAVDAEGLITFEDGQALEAMGATASEHLDRPALKVYEDFPLMRENMQRAQSGETFSSTLEFASTVFECRFTPTPEASGALGGFIAVAMDVTERSRLQRQILEISDREQARIGQDLHDGLCQQLIGLGFKLNTLEQALLTQERPEAVAASKACLVLNESIDEARRVCRGLYPIRLDTQGLKAALEEMAAAVEDRYGVECRCLAGDVVVSCDLATATHLYRIAQEAVNNSIKHSGARTVSIRLGREDERIVLQVADGGRGFNPASNPTGGMGLHIMNYRARLIGGSLELRENLGGGTLVTCRMPVTR